MLGWLPGGLAMVAVATCSLFTAFTGGSGVTIIAIGALLYPALVQSGYKEGFTLGLVTSSGSLGLLFAPLLPLIIYGIIAEVSIDELFVAGIVPGVLMMLVLAVSCLWMNRSNRRPISDFSWREVGRAARESIWELPLPFVVLGGIYTGYFAVSEAAAITAMYVFVVEVIILRDIPWNVLPELIKQSMVLVGGVLIILGAAMGLTNYLSDAEIPMQMLELFQAHIAAVRRFCWCSTCSC